MCAAVTKWVTYDITASGVPKVTKKPKPPTGESIIREKVWVDTKIINTSCKHLSNRAVHCAFKSDADPSVVPEGFAKDYEREMVEHVCFSGLSAQILKAKANRMYSRLEVNKPREDRPETKFILTSKERSSWLSLSKEYKLLPSYINEDAIEDIPKEKQREIIDRYNGDGKGTIVASGEFIIDLEGLSPAMLYIYLSTIRNIREDPGLPRAVTYLVNEVGMNFFAAYVFSSMVILNSIGHHILSVYRPYGLCKEIYDPKYCTYTSTAIDLKAIEDSILTPIGKAIGLQRMVNSDPLKYDSRNLMEMARNFNCIGTIDKISKINYLAHFQELFNEDIIAAIISKDDKEANEYIRRFTEKKPRIKYMRAEK